MGCSIKKKLTERHPLASVGIGLGPKLLLVPNMHSQKVFQKTCAIYRSLSLKWISLRSFPNCSN